MKKNNNQHERQQYPRIKDFGSSFSPLLPDDVPGYVIFNEKGQFLSRELGWWNYDTSVKDRQGYVFTQLRTCHLLQVAEMENWEHKPTFVSRATWYSIKDQVLYEEPRMTLEQFWAQVKHG